MTQHPFSGGFLERLHSGEPTLMLTVRTSRTTDVVHIARSTGHHSILVDLEHSTMSTDVAAQLCAAADSLGLTALVRVPEREYGMIGRMLDGGAHGIIAPRIETVEEARDIARACRFAPRGQRSQTNMVPQLGMRPIAAQELNPALDDATIVQILLETPAGIANADEIAALDGVDMLSLGANDFTAELGVPGQFGDPRVRDAVERLADACHKHGKLMVLGGIGDPAILDTLVPLGVCPLRITGTDSAFLFEGAQARARQALSTCLP
ncbi:HpcH/HpaI aldolase/citrate lyase family protein [Streptomyces sp. NBC_00620]|uniref:HpcH/HpaI aldolase family protein n=1 Tax=Streptomyces sp. NBC_00620 TaxID=2903666 RepID=UPI002251D2D3|nr:aldolase/citrate lyase family protein [Streptomyces sp. NBC_00620]MCX4977447.1 aldolase/citrate lyase family protein [Streptomyces sp. NBC_00620]